VDLYHRHSQHSDTRSGRECVFCSTLDPDFSARRPIDRMVMVKREDSASAHLTEDGYIRHRIVELKKKRVVTMPAVLAKSA